MNWINTKDKHFVDFLKEDDEDYQGEGSWVENDNCPQKPFLVGVHVVNNKTKEVRFEPFLVVLTDEGVLECEGEPIDWGVEDIEWWCVVEEPFTVDSDV